MRHILMDPAFEPVPIPTYDYDGNLIPPEDYETKLHGATVHVKAVVVHQYLRFKDSENYYLDLRYLRVLREPTELVQAETLPGTTVAAINPAPAAPVASSSKRCGFPSLGSGKGKAAQKD
ncbi:hypothetical protein NLI96_g5396 [Meripilus lineatus]|uniref:Uncharacterized protein n=1 Tax=Meripilus lineatus TaxID=2056292 RepID=A0AAD5YEU7_9APHY|nr:hypothetical protein NLI96_g5396 [Physisporinus lineatus]